MPSVEHASGGSSPRAGRRQHAHGHARAGAGLIPAGGEATRPAGTSPSRARAHPRGRGGDSRASRAARVRQGSSPRAGRRLVVHAHDQAVVGLIPAGGEATRRDPIARGSAGAHPRGRGGDSMSALVVGCALGSSPRAGRRRRPDGARGHHARLIPAGGEATWTSRSWSRRRGAHPRGRGGDIWSCRRGAGPLGSSPRAGRRPDPRAQGRPAPGLIPAGGEATPARPCAGSRGRAHPRGRGGDHGVGTVLVVPSGSSPRAGRRRVVGRAHGDGAGLIPAGGEATTV